MKCQVCNWNEFEMWLRTPISGDDIKSVMDELKPIPRVNTESVVMTLYCSRCRVIAYTDVRGWYTREDYPLEWNEDKKELTHKRKVVLRNPARVDYENAPLDIFNKTNIDKLMSLIAEIRDESKG